MNQKKPKEIINPVSVEGFEPLFKPPIKSPIDRYSINNILVLPVPAVNTFSSIFVISSIMAIVLFVASTLPAGLVTIQLPEIFSDHMVLQRDQPDNIWGKANPLQPVAITLTKDHQTKFKVTTRCDISGDWQIALPPLPAGGPYELVIQADNCINLKDISFGDVFLMLGQSNLIMPISHTDDQAKLSSTKQLSNFSWFNMKQRISNEEDWQTPGSWRSPKPDNIRNMPAVPYYFGAHLDQKVSSPIGLVISGFGGSPINTWLMPTDWQFHKGHYGGWQNSCVFNTMLAPLTRLKVKAVIWYQGEANVCNASEYTNTLTNFIKKLRKKFRDPSLPFFIVQLPGFGTQTDFADESAWAEMREQQANAAAATNASLIVTVDTVQPKDATIHPKSKLALAQRIADTVFAQIYLKSKDSFPSYDSFKVDGASIILSFRSHSSTLCSIINGTVRGFAIAGPDKHFLEAQAKLDQSGTHIIAWNPSIKHPCAIRYLWADNPVSLLHNADKFPLAPFRTDDWALPHNMKLDDYANSMSLQEQKISWISKQPTDRH